MGIDRRQEDTHVPVLCQEVSQWLMAGNPQIVLDCTVGYGGHAEMLLRNSAPTMKLIGLDRDSKAIAFSQERLMEFGARVILRKGNYRDIKCHLAEIGVSEVGGILFDLGVSSPQLDDPARGFSFQHDGPLDMRMDQTTGLTAAELVNGAREHELADIIFQYGEERYSRRIARAIVRDREQAPIETTGVLASIVAGAVPSAYRRGRIHCATRTFQALRIAVNQELEGLASSLHDAADLLAQGGRMCAISFHSLEDRIVKHEFRALSQRPDLGFSLLTKRPILSTEEECRTNPRARSAKLRVVERVLGRMAQ